ncbi:MAG: glycosyltransferase [Deltaproteobacteria bacterium]|nr:glycosyltransferase [Deltaproteobacteria bacterium]
MSTPTPALSVLVCTARRSAWLGDLLDDLARDTVDRPSLEVIIVDNDPLGSARDVVVGRDAPFELRYDALPEPGIAGARNRSLALARADRVLFLDDDQAIDPGFFAGLESAWRRRPHGFIGVRPRVLPRHEPGADPRFHATPSSSRQPMQPVTRLEFATNGVMLERAALLALGSAPFDRFFDLSGAEDTDLFVRLTRRGGRIAWCPEVVVWERIPPERASLAHLYRYDFRVGVTGALLARRTLGASTGAELAEVAAKLAWIALKVGLAPTRVRPTAVVSQLVRVAGQAYGALDGRYEPYRAKR